MAARDRWAEWVLRGQHRAGLRHTSDSMFLRSVRDRVLENAGVAEGDTLLDIGAGDGLVAFGALELVGERSGVIFCDVSEELLGHCRSLAQEKGVAERCRFLRMPADNLGALESASVDVVTTRSVLIFVKNKQRAFGEFYRVLKPGGRFSIFEPISSFYWPEPPDRFLGYEVSPVRDLARKVRAVYERIQPPDTDPMLNFDERDLFALAEDAGFGEIRIDYRAEVVAGNPAGWETTSWEKFAASAGNPKVPPVGEAMAEALTPDEAERFAAHLRPLVEGARRRARTAVAYLRAVK